MSTRSGRILKAALETNTNTSSDYVADVLVSELQPFTSYEFVISGEGILQHENLTLEKPVSINCFEEFCHNQDLVSDNSVLSNENPSLIQSVKLTDIEGIPLSDDLVNLEPVEPIHFDNEIIEENPLNRDLLESLEPKKPIYFANKLTEEIPPNHELIMESLEPDNVDNAHESVLGNEAKEKSGGNGKRRKTANQNEWDRNKNKRLRMTGEQYIGYTRSKTGDIKHNIERPARKLGDMCMCSGKHNKCKKISEIERQEIFNRFWTLTWEQKKMYVRSLAQYIEKKRSYTQSASRRTGTIVYSLQLDANKLPVCKRMFMSTLGIGERMIRNWLTEPVQHGMPLAKHQKNKTKKQVDDAKRIQFAREVINRFPKLPSHYCRKYSTKFYLEERFRNKTEVYNVYKEECTKSNELPLSIFSFSKLLEENNIAIHLPKKDQCDVCCSYKVGQVDEESFKKHVIDKNRARTEKEKDKAGALEKKCYTLTMDVQAVQLCPKLFASKLYFKSKLQFHNFTIYNVETHKSDNYCWNESEGELVSSVFTSCIMDYLEKHCLEEPRSINIYSDNCGYQNKNVILSNALLSFSVQSGITIFQKYLEKGHTQMECDSTHALIERKLKHREIHIPSQYSLAIKEARLKPFPLDVHYITHDFFMKYDNKDLYTYQSIRPGRNVNDAKVTDVKTFKYCPDGKIFYKLSYDDEYYVELPCRSNTNNLSNQLRCRLYDNRIKITKKKFKDLQELTSVLSKEVKDFYLSLPYHSEDKNQGNKKAKQKTESDESENNQEIAKLEKTSLKKKAINLKSTTKYKNKGNDKAKQKTESDNLEKKQETVNNNEIRRVKKKFPKRKSATRIEKTSVRKRTDNSKSALKEMPCKRKPKKK